MVSVASLLNPLPMDLETSKGLTTPYTDRYNSTEYFTPPPELPPPPQKNAKMVKDAAVFAKGKIKGEVRYPAFEVIKDEASCREMSKFRIYPLGRIQEFPRHIPYNSDKKGFLEKTGRESFEVFQYTFKVPGEDSSYTVMWDYNVGLVRITPFFKCCKYSKTTPAKMLNSNPGLRDICHSITGGALAAQGYWMPYEAARAMAATFCYPIRYALVPLFGPDFVSLCCHPEDPAFGRMVIDSDIVRHCTVKAQEYRAMEEDKEYAKVPLLLPTSNTLSSCANFNIFWKIKPPRKDVGNRDLYAESGYGTDTDASEKCPLFPDAASEAAWKSAELHLCRSSRFGEVPRPPVSVWTPPTPTTINTTADMPRAKRSLSGVDEEYEYDSSTDHSSDYGGVPRCKRRKSATHSKETKAAYMLMQLHVADAALELDEEKCPRRSSS